MLNKTSAAWRRDPVILVAGLIVVTSAVVWVAALWPASITDDGVYLLGEVKRNTFTNDHPVLNGILLWSLVKPFGSIVPYTVCQAALCVSLTVWALATIRRVGAPAWIILAASLAIAASIPIGSYWTMVWKDVPSGFAVLALGVLIFRTALGVPLQLRKTYQIAAYALLILLASYLRHGWEIILILAPAMLLATTRHPIDRRTRIVLICVPVVAALVMHLAAPRLLTSSGDKTHLKVMVAAQPYAAIVGSRRGYVSPDPEKDRVLMSAVFTDPKVVTEYLPFHILPIQPAIRTDISEAIANALIRRVMTLCLWNIGPCLADRLAMLLGTLQPATLYGMVWYNLGDLALHHARNRQLGYEQILREFGVVAGDSRLEDAGRGIMLWANEPLRKQIVWNAVPQFALIILSVLLMRWLPATGFASLFILALSFVPFFSSVTDNFRYYFFLYVFGFFVLPMMFAERAVRAKTQRD